MKKAIVLLSIVLVSGAVFAQKANVSKAKNKALSTESPDFAGAREAIKLALEDPTTKDQANTWYVAGLIGYKECESLYFQLQMGQKIDDTAKGEAVMESVNYFVVADSLGQIPNEKGKINTRIRKDIMPKMLEYYQQQHLVMYGAYLFEQKNYARAYDAFKMHVSIPDMPMFQDEKEQAKMPRDTVYSQYKYYTALAASNAGLNKEAIAIYKDLTDEDYEPVTVYQLLYQEYFNLKDTVNYVNTLKEAFQKFPTEPWFLQNLINHFIFTGQTEESLVYLRNAIEREPNVAQYHYVKGNVDETLGNVEDAKVDFQKAIELEPTMADAYAGMGRVYFNVAVNMLDEASNLQDQAQYEQELQKAQDIFKESLPYFQKAAELNPDDTDYKMTLRTLYYRLGMDAEYEAINKELNM